MENCFNVAFPSFYVKNTRGCLNSYVVVLPVKNKHTYIFYSKLKRAVTLTILSTKCLLVREVKTWQPHHMPKLICHENSVFKCNHIVEDFEKSTLPSPRSFASIFTVHKGFLDAQNRGITTRDILKIVMAATITMEVVRCL